MIEDRYSKYIKLSFRLFLTFLSFIAILGLLLVTLKFVFGMLDQIPWFVLIYMLFIILVPASLFISIFVYYFKRTRSHPSSAVRWISYTLFSIALITWVVCIVLDLAHFFDKQSREIGGYYSYNIFLLTASVVLIFLVGILQALKSAKEEDWMEKRRKRESPFE